MVPRAGPSADEPPVSERETSAPMPWVALPGKRLPPGPPLWAIYRADGRVAATVTPAEFGHAAERYCSAAAGLEGDAGWVPVVDSEGRSR